jgi:hypothetical protein
MVHDNLGDSMSNVYYAPEKFGLTAFGQVDDGGPYEFDLFVVWTSGDDSNVLWGTDSGCSCPSPFEDTGINDLSRGTKWECISALSDWSGRWNRSTAGEDIVRLIERLVAL